MGSGRIHGVDGDGGRHQLVQLRGRGLHSFPFPLNLSLLFPFPLNSSLLVPQMTRIDPWMCS